MILYHYTNWIHYLEICASGEILTTESNIGSGRKDWLPYGEHVGPDVVWLTSSPYVSGSGVELDPMGVLDRGPEMIEVDPTRIRITVDLPENEVHRWTPWSRQHRMNPKWRRVLEEGMKPQDWYVIERNVPISEVLSEMTTIDGELFAYLEATYGESVMAQILVHGGQGD